MAECKCRSGAIATPLTVYLLIALGIGQTYVHQDNWWRAIWWPYYLGVKLTGWLFS